MLDAKEISDLVCVKYIKLPISWWYNVASIRGVSPLVQNEELTTMWLKILGTTSFSSDLLLNMSNFDWPNYKGLKIMTNLVTR